MWPALPRASTLLRDSIGIGRVVRGQATVRVPYFLPEQTRSLYSGCPSLRAVTPMRSALPARSFRAVTAVASVLAGVAIR